MMSKSLRDSARRSSSTMMIAGCIIGRMTIRQRSKVELESRRAHSIRSSGMPWSAARKTRKQKGVHCQMSTMITETSAQSGSESQGMPRNASGPPSS